MKKKKLKEKSFRNGFFWLICIVSIKLVCFFGGAFLRYLYEKVYIAAINKDCFLSRTMAEERSGFGILNLHTGQMIIIKPDDDKQGSSAMISGDVGSTVWIRSEGKGVIEIDITLSEASEWQSDLTKELICEECMEKLLNSHEVVIRDDIVMYDIALIDFKDDSIHQVIRDVPSYYSSDYYLHFDYYNKRIDVRVVDLSE